MRLCLLSARAQATSWVVGAQALPLIYAAAVHNELNSQPLATVGVPREIKSLSSTSRPTSTTIGNSETVASSSTIPTTPVTTTASPESITPSKHWTPDRPDPYVCEYLGENDCWRPQYPQGGPPYMHSGKWPLRSKTCSIPASHDPNGDDAPAILKAFAKCRQDGHIVFENTTYYVGSVMNTTGLKDVDVEVKGTLLWSTDVDYWLNNSLPVGYQNQSSAWYFGGDGVHFYGHGYGTLDGNGQVWYDCEYGPLLQYPQHIRFLTRPQPIRRQGRAQHPRPAARHHHF